MTVRYWTGQAATYEFDYDNGAHSPVVGETINVDTEAGETAVIQSWTVTGGAWATNDATGKMWVYSCSASFITNLQNNDNIDDSADNQICITTGGVTLKTGDWQAAGNWGTGEDPAVPLADDEVIFDGRSVIVPSGGMLDGESGAVAQCTYDLLHFKKTWAYGVATAAEPLCCSPDSLIIEGTGTYYILCGKTDQSTDTTIGKTIINNKDATVYIYSNANDGANTTEFDKVFVVAGTVYLSFYTVDTDDQGVYVDELYLCPRGASDAIVYIAKDCYKVNGTVPTDIFMNNGTLTTDSMVGTFIMDKGTVTYGTDLTTTPETDLNITELRQYGGTFTWQPDDSGNDAYIGDLWLFGGSFVASGTTNNDRSKALGNGAGNDIHIFAGASLDMANGKGNITIAGSSQLWNYGGTLTVDGGAQVAISYDQP
ncbi:MAG: hypothetical protein ACYS1A_20110 [Planctomycetota bacterium]|jgi:hypothetical protein